MDTEPHAILARVDAILAELPRPAPDHTVGAEADPDTTDIDAVGHRLEEAHQILVDALESVEKD